MLRSIFQLLSFITISLFISTGAFSATEDSDFKWPQEITTDKGSVIIYQPQPESLNEDKLKSRAAVSIELNGAESPVFGAIWFTAQLKIDRDERTSTIANINITNVRFPESGNKKYEKLTILLEKEIPKWDLTISMDQLISSLEIEDQRNIQATKINTLPPEIIFVEKPAILISIDGEPEMRSVPSRSLKRIINTAFTIIYEPGEKIYYLNADKNTWYVTKDLMGEWTVGSDIPRGISELAPEEPEDTEELMTDITGEKIKPGPPPIIIVRTKPAELISSTDKAEFKPIEGMTELLYMSNTDSDVLMDINSQSYYVLLAGRWYTSKKMQGEWKYVPGKSLPEYFSKIPEDSNMGSVLYAVPGTRIAKNAVLDAQIPQTAAIKRSQANLQVEYDGLAIFQPIDGTTLSYAVNTATPVIKVTSNEYYAVDDGVWFTANNANGQWHIATKIPNIIYTIPANSPVYNVTFVKIYKVEPEVVYMGYTPGYTYTYIYGSSIVYGTGYYYPGWYHTWYYPHPATWGYHARWNPYMGWGFGMSYSSGPFTFYIGTGSWYHGGWWGPRLYFPYRYGYRHAYRHGARPGYRPSHRRTSNNIYKNPRNRARVTSANSKTNKAYARPATNRANNVYTDRQGNVHRKTNQGWQTRDNKSWKNSTGTRDINRPSTKPSNSRPATRPQQGKYGGFNNQQQLQRNYQSRNQGIQNRRNFNNYRGGGRAARAPVRR